MGSTVGTGGGAIDVSSDQLGVYTNQFANDNTGVNDTLALSDASVQGIGFYVGNRSASGARQFYFNGSSD